MFKSKNTVDQPGIVTKSLEPKKRRYEEEEEEGPPRKMDYMSKIDAIPVPTLSEWDPTTLPTDFFVVLEGKRRTGKSTFAKWLLQYYKRNFFIAWCMTMTKASGYWQEFVGPQFTFDGWVPAAVDNLIKRNDAIIRKYGEDSPITRRECATLIILDDVVSAKIHDDPVFVRLAVEGRHHLISVLLLVQDPKAVGPKVRDNCDVAVIFNQKTLRNKEAIWNDFFNDVTKDEAMAMMKRYCQEHNTIVAVQTSLTPDIQSTFYVSTGDKTKLDDPHYCLGNAHQREMVLEARRSRKKSLRDNVRGAREAKFANDETKRLVAAFFE